VGRRLDPAHFEFLQFFDVAENVAELFAEFLFFSGSEFDARQARDVLDIKSVADMNQG